MPFDYEKFIALLETHNWNYENEKNKAAQLQGWKEREAILNVVNDGPIEARFVFDAYLRAFGRKGIENV